jgi:hypothetical protein
MTGRSPEIRFECRPRDDRDFAACVATLAAGLPADATGLDLQRALRATYPSAIVVPAGRLAPLGTSAVRYVYRDGTEEDVRAG